MPTNLNDYDILYAVSQETINNQFVQLFGDVISTTMTIQYLPSDSSLLLDTTIACPTVELRTADSNMHQLYFNIKQVSGKLTYKDLFASNPDKVETLVMDGHTFRITVNLNQMELSSSSTSNLVIKELTQQALADYLANEAFTVKALYLDFESVAIESAVIFDPDGKKHDEGKPDYPFLLAAINQIINNLKAKNPYTVGFQASSNNPEVTSPQLPLLAPTGMQFITDDYNYSGVNDGSKDFLNALCYLCVTNKKAFPYADPTQISALTWNPIYADDVQAVMIIANNTFNKDYIESRVLKLLKEGITTTVEWTNPSADHWSLVDHQSDEGHGRELATGFYGVEKKEREINLWLDTDKTAKNKQLVYSGKVRFFEGVDCYTFRKGTTPTTKGNNWHYSGWQAETLEFDFELTFTAGAGGAITASCTNNASDPVETGADHDNWSESWDWLLGSHMTDKKKDLLKVQKLFCNTNLNAFKESAGKGLEKLSKLIILPGGKDLLFSDIGINAERDIVFKVTYS